MRCCAWAMAAWLAGAMLGGCDTNDDVPPEVIQARQAAQREASATKPAPTTQELLIGPKQTLRLGGFPLSLEVPTNWALRSMADGQLITVAGPASSGDISIQLNSLGQSVPAARLDDIVAGVKRETDAKPHPVNRAGVRALGPAKVLEQRMISNPMINGKLPPEVWGESEFENEKTKEKRMIRGIINPHILKWTFTVFVPSGDDKYVMRSLTFMGLKLSEYEQDKEFLERMMQSLKYEE